jgi:tRNA-specific 2-thiouridylase
MFHTIGQRQGLGIGGLKHADDAPWYVSDKDIDTNTLWVCQGNDHPALFAHGLTVTGIFWIQADLPETPLRCTAKVRYRQPDQSCTVYGSNTGYHIVFDEPQRAITPGQSVVLYCEDECLGGGVIEAVTDRLEELVS